MSSTDQIQAPGDPRIPLNITSSPPPLTHSANQTIPELVMSDDIIIPNIRVNSDPSLPSFALNSDDSLMEYLSSSPSCLRQQKRSQLYPTERPFAKVPRLTIPAIPFSFSSNSQTNQASQTSQTNLDQITEYVLQARDLLLKACSSCKAHDRQSRLLDLLEIFREYTEFGRVRHTNTLLASQVANLEKATQRIEKQAKAPIQAQAKAQAKVLNQPSTQPSTQ
jgi:hypothetical protein